MKKSGGHLGNSRGNRAQPHAPQSMAVHPVKDTMAKNVSNHMSQGDVPNVMENVKTSHGGKAMKGGKAKNKY